MHQNQKAPIAPACIVAYRMAAWQRTVEAAEPLVLVLCFFRLAAVSSISNTREDGALRLLKTKTQGSKNEELQLKNNAIVLEPGHHSDWPPRIARFPGDFDRSIVPSEGSLGFSAPAADNVAFPRLCFEKLKRNPFLFILESARVDCTSLGAV